MTVEDGHLLLPNNRNKLFDMQVVCEMLVAGIILYSSEIKHLEVDEDEVAEFIIKNFPQIVSSITDGETGL